MPFDIDCIDYFTITCILRIYLFSVAHLKHLDLSGSLLIHTNHASMFAEFKHNGQPIVVLPPSQAPNIPYDDDP